MLAEPALWLLVCAALVLVWSPVVADLADEFRNFPPPHSRRRQRQARRNADATRSHVAGPPPGITAVREHSPSPYYAHAGTRRAITGSGHTPDPVPAAGHHV
ncbi:hypothetical protein FHR84_003256 [Actinopolyspora biskrensis]|uniref:Uncharacterized protein n=1 Tax=Actinopolyspora biskrensis TaxID=1470178 RepID=A0A852ZBB5_9ACTN|nr:hypothetical protein [Actinopolyspora biskrensis]NYH79907.1 hypothetical protein [Actinopolyspora biskrensis]